jgi:diadenosine tetraphosphate (Ap4A) HIT family hydrolase
LGRVEVWQDSLWRVTVSLVAPVLGFGYLEPKRHIPYITDISGEVAEMLGTTLARVTSALRNATDADLVYVNVFGERHAHLHFNLAPHRVGDGLTGGPGMIRPNAAPIAKTALEAVADRIRRHLA